MNAKLVLILSLLGFLGLCFGQAKQSRQEEIVRVVERYDNAWNTRNAGVMKEIMAPDYVYFTSKGETRSRQQLFDEFLSPNYHLASAERSEMKVYASPATAVVSSRWKGHGTYNGQEFHDDQRCSIVLTREESGWHVLSEHCTQIAAR